ncbi:MAG: peroxide stress protein YaaA [Bacteroidales bacterium]|nr:peroxide stress protein YaaA [Bacteroidales bacterium]MCF8457524.1 peroxide stress protein YaaA [Bacteroidales bacterium]
MLIVISPAKTLDMEGSPVIEKYSEPDYLKEAKRLITQLKKLKPHQLANLMDISPKLVDLNYSRYRAWSVPFSKENAKQAILAFRGEVYTGIDADSLALEDFDFAQDHLRILSGLYGVLKPLDLIQAYRLEMGINFQTPKWNDLYDFWGTKITRRIQSDLKNQGDDILINLASIEYYRSINSKKLKAKIITPTFKDFNKGEYKMISIYAKKARGLMTRFIIQNKLSAPEQLKLFDAEGYFFNEEFSKGNMLVFTRG